MFDIEIVYDYNEDISKWRENSIKNNPSYDIDKEYPILYILKPKFLSYCVLYWL